jgi:hypothetical protein
LPQTVSAGLIWPFPPQSLPAASIKKEKEKTLNLFEPVLSRTVTNLFDWAKVK